MSTENPTLAECVEFARKQMRGAFTPKKVRLYEEVLAHLQGIQQENRLGAKPSRKCLRCGAGPEWLE